MSLLDELALKAERDDLRRLIKIEKAAADHRGHDTRRFPTKKAAELWVANHRVQRAQNPNHGASLRFVEYFQRRFGRNPVTLTTP